MRYMVRQKIFSIGDSFAIKDEAGYDAFIVKSQVLSFGKKLRIFDLSGLEQCYIEQKLFRFMPEYSIYIQGQNIATIKKKLAFFKNDFTISSIAGNFTIEGNLWAREFEIFKDLQLVGRISKQFFSLTDTYGVDLDDKENQVLLLALAIVIDMVCHDRE